MVVALRVEDGELLPPKKRIHKIPTKSQAPKSSVGPPTQPAVDECSPSFSLLETLRVGGFRELMARARVKIQSVELLEFANARERLRLERTFAVKGVQHDPFQ
jgi:hypothetical protein